jgi:uncharacterized protein (DUF2147 family)
MAYEAAAPQSDHESDRLSGHMADQSMFRRKRAMKHHFSAILVGLILASPALGAADKTAAGKTAAGFWQQADNDGHVGAWFYFTEVNGLYEGRLVKMFKQPGETQIIDVCTKCTGNQKNAPMLGLTIVKSMRRDGLKYQDGSILDPRDGTVYHAQMELSPDGKKLAVRGYLGVPLLGQTQTWTRLPDNVIAPADIPKDSVSADSE